MDGLCGAQLALAWLVDGCDLQRVIAIFVGLTAGYRGGWVDRILMSINDSFVVMPVLFQILILLSFLLHGKMSLMMLAFIMGLFGWPWDARLIRAQVLSLKERPFTRTAVYSGTPSFQITLNEHLPFVLPVVFATTINNLLWSIGMEVTLSVLGLSDVALPTIGTTIFWANQRALVAGIWWSLGAPVLVAIILFLACICSSRASTSTLTRVPAYGNRRLNDGAP